MSEAKLKNWKDRAGEWIKMPGIVSAYANLYCALNFTELQLTRQIKKRDTDI